MIFSNINTSTINVELTDERKRLIQKQLSPLSRFLVHQEAIAIDVVIRGMKNTFGSDTFYVSVKIATADDSYMAVTANRYLARALSEARESLRRSISRGPSVQIQKRASASLQVPNQAAYTLSLQS